MNPYIGLSEKHFWKPSAAKFQESSFIEELWIPKFEISDNAAIITAGSCFAQNIGRWLKKNEFNWMNFPDSSKNSDKNQNRTEAPKFSFETGNIYTARQLRQWIAQALGDIKIIDTVLERDGRFYDAQRQMEEPCGFESHEDMLESKTKLLKNIKIGIETADIFIFTLGLTEGWEDRGGVAYSSAPGVIAGEFDASNHQFKNYSYHEILSDIVWVINRLKNVNNNLKFLTTVSPVPLTATASQNHVLVASTASKSVLRAVCEELIFEHNDVDYFPSFDLLTSHINVDSKFTDNLRTISSEGVEFVMKHFERSIGARTSDNLKDANTPAMHKKHLKSEIDLECEESLLENWAPREVNVNNQLYLIGDSQLGRLSAALNRSGVDHYGGGIMAGSAWTDQKFALDEEELFVPLETVEARKKWCETFAKLSSNSEQQKIIITNIGEQTHRSVTGYVEFVSKNCENKISDDSFMQFIKTQCNLQMQLLIKFCKLPNTKVIFVTDPPTQLFQQSLEDKLHFWRYYDKCISKVVKSIGCDVFNARVHFGDVGLPEKYFSGKHFNNGQVDWFHGGEAYYDDLGLALLEKINKKSYISAISHSDEMSNKLSA
ncbi:MAG: hypothetical protein CBC12_14295 [Candidatus Puniceispirillum sp. TMED52]|nr:MAG: hypothetical protein CBC12_14295 [Candidatus Puniceispirillum sp. TMED52]